MIEAVIFDIDGTLHDWELSISLALRDLLPEVPAEHREGLEGRLQAATVEHFFVERDGLVVDRKHWMYLVDPLSPWRTALAGANSATVDRIAQRFRSLLEAVSFADVPPTIEALSQEYSLGAFSNNPSAVDIVGRLGLRHYFGEVVVASEPSKKPAPEGFLKACEALGVVPGETAYVGDSIYNDVEGALGAGLVPVWLDRYGDPYPLPAGVHRVQSLDELPGLLRGLTEGG